ncbi:unnamed protein product [Arabidopsis thaliana]|uniref:(thale cress) hypothetical protein n=1 Tax=Arabidopsis thaliana TaxID=3702 RepID=A0A7G2E2K7_ARATH|nr:unnamed protein product [Arabidopsis thaliana]
MDFLLKLQGHGMLGYIILELIHREDVGEVHEENDVMEDITKKNHNEVGEVVQGVPQLRRSGRQISQSRYLEDYVMQSETTYGLFHQAYVKSKRRQLSTSNEPRG